jgi:hypothetical protein
VSVLYLADLGARWLSEPLTCIGGEAGLVQWERRKARNVVQKSCEI